ncbi:MAG TPA: hypothetical protein VLT16_02120 [Candidatus Limnocylindrales bacterium]|nr:hypothetical protein [Candidatus Limnocylindrales bacterium]
MSLKNLAMLLSFLVMSAAMHPQNTVKNRQSWIERLKQTPVSQLDPALPDKPFAAWFADRVKPAQPQYEVDDCGERSGTPEDRGKSFPLCVVVSANIQPVRKLELMFVVASYTVPAEGAAATAPKETKVEFLHGTVGPSDPRSKQPTRLVRKLSDVEGLTQAQPSPTAP